MSSIPSIPSVPRNTIPIISKYELTTVLAVRAAEIANGEPTTIPNPGTSDPIAISIMEYNAGKLPNKIKRIWPNGNVEVWSLNEFQKLI